MSGQWVQSSANINTIISGTWKDVRIHYIPWNLLPNLLPWLQRLPPFNYNDINPTPKSKDALQEISWQFSEMVIAIPQSIVIHFHFCWIGVTMVTNACDTIFLVWRPFSYITRQNLFAPKNRGQNQKLQKSVIIAWPMPKTSCCCGNI